MKVLFLLLPVFLFSFPAIAEEVAPKQAEEEKSTLAKKNEPQQDIFAVAGKDYEY